MQPDVSLCPYCGNPANLVGGDVIYPRRPDLRDRWFWSCAPCGAYVGCHRGDGGMVPLGQLANSTLRRAKQSAHAVFDPLWEEKMRREKITKKHARGKAYAWLAEQLGIEPAATHIGMFDEETCARVVAICGPFARRLKSREAA